MNSFKEYCIYCVWNGGKPFIFKTYTSFQQAKIDLLDMVALEEERNRPYYVDNEFFNNKYNIGIKGKYFSIQERYITKWIKSTENIKPNCNDKLLYFNQINNFL